MSDLVIPAAVRLAPDVVLQVVGEDAVLLNLHDETVFALNETGARIAQLIADGQDLSAVADTLAGEYNAERAAVMRDVEALVQVLLVRGLVEIHARPR